MHVTSPNIFQFPKMCKSTSLQILGTAVQDSTQQLPKFSCLWIIISVRLYTTCDFLRYFLPFCFFYNANSVGQEQAACHTLLCLVCLVWCSWVAMDTDCADMEIDSDWKLRMLDLYSISQGYRHLGWEYNTKSTALLEVKCESDSTINISGCWALCESFALAERQMLWFAGCTSLSCVSRQRWGNTVYCCAI